MSNTPHTLHDEFPAEAQKISALKVANAHFAKLLVDYDVVNDKIHRSETRLDLLTEADEEVLRKTRSHLKDQIWAALRKA
ncbi:YdcH family protein [Tabrizicola sp.]|uniref:YdcH family protein n=1 Tax=Tabrizicola sp. TaxID=2005166 RepID=UPI003F38025D